MLNKDNILKYNKLNRNIKQFKKFISGFSKSMFAMGVISAALLLIYQILNYIDKTSSSSGEFGIKLLLFLGFLISIGFGISNIDVKGGK